MMDINTIKKIYGINDNPEMTAKELRETVLSHHSRGKSVGWISDKMEISNADIKKILMHVNRKYDRTQIEEKHKEVIRLYFEYHAENGKTNYSQIARDVGYQLSTVKKIVLTHKAGERK